MAINLRGLPIVPGARTLTSGGPPIALNNEIRGGIHRISGSADNNDQLGDIDARYLQVGMLVYDETQDTYYMYKNQDGPEPTGNPDSNDPYRGAVVQRIVCCVLPGHYGIVRICVIHSGNLEYLARSWCNPICERYIAEALKSSMIDA